MLARVTPASGIPDGHTSSTPVPRARSRTRKDLIMDNNQDRRRQRKQEQDEARREAQRALQRSLESRW